MKLFTIFFFIVAIKAQQSCQPDSACDDQPPCVGQFCIGKALFPLNVQEIVGTGILVFVSSVAHAGGIGGSSVVINVMLLIFSFAGHAAIAYAIVFIFAGATSVIALQIQNRHPYKDRPLICYDLLLQIIGPLVLGARLGVELNPIVPVWVLLFLIAILTAFSLCDIWGKCRRIYKIEYYSPLVHSKSSISAHPETPLARLIKSFIQDQDISFDSQHFQELRMKFFQRSSENLQNLLESQSESEKPVEKPESQYAYEEQQDFKSLSAEEAYEKLQIEITHIYEKDREFISTNFIICCIALILINIVYTIVNVYVEKIPWMQMSLICVYILSTIIVIGIASRHLVRKTGILAAGDFDFDEWEIVWTYKKCLCTGVLAWIAGFFVGLLGTGGGNIISPLLIAMGLRPEVAAVTHSFAIFLLSGVAGVEYYRDGYYDLLYVSWFLVFSFVGSLLGIMCLRKIIFKKSKMFLLMSFLTGFLMFAVITSTVFGMISAYNFIVN